jgi:PIN domain nuclease of toxin-antitoxin system
VLDASEVLAYLKREPGYEQVREALTAGAAISTANLAEVYAKGGAAGQELNDEAACSCTRN